MYNGPWFWNLVSWTNNKRRKYEKTKTSSSKVLRTRKIKTNPQWSIGMYSYFCSNTCYNEFANTYIEQVIAIAPRREPLETPIEVEKIHHPEERHGREGEYQWTRQAWTETKITER